MAKKKVLSPEEIQARNKKIKQETLERELRDLRAAFYPKSPTCFFEPGEEVTYGAHKKTIVREKLDNGEIYLVDVKSQSQTGVDNEGLRYLSWIEIRKKANHWDQIILRNQEYQRIQYYQGMLQSLFLRQYHFGIDMNPEYQRDHVWSLDDKIELIDSIMNNVDIGKFVLVERTLEENREKGTGLFEILDGKQRLTALLEFYEDRFRYKGKLFSELNPGDSNHFETYNISIAELRNLDLQKRIETFVRLNTAGRIMDKEHLEKVKQMLTK